MAEEVAGGGNPSQQTASPPDSGSDEVINLESLVRDMEAPAGAAEKQPTIVEEREDTPVPVTVKVSDASKPQAKPSEPVVAKPAVPEVKAAAEGTDAKPAPVSEEPLSEEQLDGILAIESPETAAELAAIREIAKTEASEISNVANATGEEAELLALSGGLTWRQKSLLLRLKLVSIGRGARNLVKVAMKDSKGLLRAALVRSKVSITNWLHRRKAQIGDSINWFRSRTGTQKLAMLVAIAILPALAFVLMKTFKGSLMPKTEKQWIASFTEKADEVFTYAPTDAFEDFNDPILHPEFVILVERIVVNLARTAEAGDSANPMAAFELYLQTDNQEAAIELKDRGIEIRDVTARAVERMSYPDLALEEGKTKLKLVIRKEINEILTKGRVRRVFFKTLVLNPE